MRRGASPTTLSWDAFAASGAATIPCGTRVVVDGGDVAAPNGLRVEDCDVSCLSLLPPTSPSFVPRIPSARSYLRAFAAA